MHVLQMAVALLTFLVLVVTVAILPRSLIRCVAKDHDAGVRSVRRSSGQGPGTSSTEDCAAGGQPLSWRVICPAQCCRECLSDLPSSALLCRETLVPRQTARATS